jgi:DNA-binding PadR family transcriptional regulator
MSKLTEIKLVNPYHMEMESNGHGEFPDSYKLNKKGVEALEKAMDIDSIKNFVNKILETDGKNIWNYERRDIVKMAKKLKESLS